METNKRVAGARAKKKAVNFVGRLCRNRLESREFDKVYDKVKHQSNGLGQTLKAPAYFLMAWH